MNMQIPILQIYPLDILVLLTVSSLFVTLCQIYLYVIQRTSSTEQALYKNIYMHRHLVAQGRTKGPSAFVETSKLERALLQLEKQMNDTKTTRSNQIDAFLKLKKRIGYALYILVFALYYGIPMIQMDGFRVSNMDEDSSSRNVEDTEDVVAAQFMKELLFPMYASRFFIRLANWGLPSTCNPFSSLGALMIFWSGEITITKLLESAFGFLLRL